MKSSEGVYKVYKVRTLRNRCALSTQVQWTGHLSLIWRNVLYSDEVEEVALLMVVDRGDKRSVISVRLPKRFERNNSY
jgi:hypothetical protein